MNKVKINNQVVSMRKFVKQSKVHVINKLVKEVKLYQVKKGKEEQMAKYTRKAERLKLEIEIIKKLPVDDVSKMSLLNQKNWTNIITDKTTTVKERSFAKLINYKIVQQEVKKFHEKYPDLVQQLPDLLHQWEQRKLQSEKEPIKNITASELRKKKKEKKLRMKSKKEQKKLSLQESRTNFVNRSSATENLQNTNQETISRNSSDENDLVFNVSDGNNSCAKNSKVNDSDTNDHSMNIMQHLLCNRGSSKDTEEELSIKKSKAHKLKVNNSAVPYKVTRREKIENMQEMKYVDNDELSENSSSVDVNSCSETMLNISESDDLTLNQKVIDPFFLGDVVCEKNTEHDAFFNSNSDKKIMKQNNLTRNLSSTNKPFKEKNVRNSSTNNRKLFNNFHQNKLYSGTSHSGRKNSYLRTENTGEERCGTYRKGKLILRKNNSKSNYHIQEKRIKHSDAVYSQKSFGPRRDRKEIFHGKNNVAKYNPKTNATSGLHPSWEAKRKLKEKTLRNIPFQGKKVKFED